MKKLSLIIFLLYFFSSTQAQKYGEVKKDLLTQLSQGNWQFVYDKINDTINKVPPADSKKTKKRVVNNKTSNTDCNRQAVSRFLYGHAALITGKNNISTRQFYCACDSTGSQSLSNWFYFTSEFEKEYPNSFVSHYLLGDAYARKGEIKEAKAQLDTAISLNPKNVASLNCRAVITWLLYENNDSKDEQMKLKLSAIADIQKGVRLNPRFADLYANEAIIDMRNSGEMSNSRHDLEAAIQIDSTYYLAQNSLAFSYGEEGNKPKYDDINEFINKYGPQTPFINRIVADKNKGGQTARGNMTIGVNIGPLSLGTSFKDLAGLNFGGVYSYLKDGDNLITLSDHNPVIIGTWFNFNYPNKSLTVKKDK
jgi:tetratricopeptide (TPR) repeat protein